jgi:hypothetical protein
VTSDQPGNEIGGNVFPERGKPQRHVRDRAREVLDLGQLRRMPRDLVEVEALDMPDLIDDLDQRCGDQALRQPCR